MADWVSDLIAGAALLLTVITLVIERIERTRANGRLFDLESARDERETERAQREQTALSSASPRILSVVMTVAPRVSSQFTVELVNRGADTAHNLSVGARLELLHGATLGSPRIVVDDERAEFRRVRDGLPPDVLSLPSGESVELSFWYSRVELTIDFRVAWLDGQGEHVADQTVTVRRHGDPGS
jgi:hypothetical protein